MTSYEEFGPGHLKYLLAVEVARSFEGIFLCQRKYTLDIVVECGLFGAHSFEGIFLCQRKYTLDIVVECGLFGAPPYFLDGPASSSCSCYR